MPGIHTTEGKSAENMEKESWKNKFAFLVFMIVSLEIVFEQYFLHVAKFP